MTSIRLRRPLLVSLASLAMGVCAAETPAAPGDSPDLSESATRIEADVRFLADDLLEGREAGTRGFDLAALYVAARYRMMGLQPAGDGGTYFQAVPMLRGTRLREDARFAITRGGETSELIFQQDYLPDQTYDADSCRIDSAPMAFVGQAVDAPELGHSDFTGVDLRGKVAVVLRNAPSRFPNDQRAFHADWEQKAAALARRGAVGAVVLNDPVVEQSRPWDRGAAGWQRPGMRVLDPDGKPLDTHPALRCVAYVRADRAAMLFAASPFDAKTVFDMFQRGTLRPFDLEGTITLAARTKLERVTSHNVVGRIDAAPNLLDDEHVVLTAHLDHLGVGAPRNGDAIYNGAQDNAVGTAVMLEAGGRLQADRGQLRRSVLLVATTAEEKGLLGAAYFASHPTVPRESIVANVNLDLPYTVADVSDVIPVGIEHSTLETLTQRAVAESGLTLTPDPIPEEVVFIRSDQYPFVKAGVPAVYLLAGIRRKDGTDGLQSLERYLSDTYHLPNDDLAQPIDWLGAARLAVVNHNIARAIATQPERPRWKPGDFFGTRFASPVR